MLKLFLFSLFFVCLSCSKTKTEKNVLEELHLKTFSKMSAEQIMCVGQTCVTEEELYRQHGAALYSQEDKLFYLKYKFAKDILLKKILSEKIKASNKTIADYEKELIVKMAASDKEIQDYLIRFEVKDIEKNSDEWLTLQKSITRSKIQEHYLKLLGESKAPKNIMVKIPKKERVQVQLPFEKLLRFNKNADDQFKITLVFNPARKEQRNLIRMVESLTSYLAKTDKKIGFYFFPFSTDIAIESLYQKLFICSLKNDNAKSYNAVMDLAKMLESEANIIEFLSGQKLAVDQIKTCMNSKEIFKKVENYNTLLKDLKLMPMVQIIYNNELEFQVPGLIELSQRIDDKLKIKTLQQ